MIIATSYTTSHPSASQKQTQPSRTTTQTPPKEEENLIADHLASTKWTHAASIADGDFHPMMDLSSASSSSNVSDHRALPSNLWNAHKRMVDSGTSVNIMDAKTYRSIPNAAPLKPTAIRTYPYGSNQELPLLGELSAVVKSKQHATETTFCVARAGKMPLLSYDTARELRLMKPTLSTVTTAPTLTTIQRPR